jgi:hypothetical protein
VIILSKVIARTCQKGSQAIGTIRSLILQKTGVKMETVFLISAAGISLLALLSIAGRLVRWARRRSQPVFLAGRPGWVMLTVSRIEPSERGVRLSFDFPDGFLLFPGEALEIALPVGEEPFLGMNLRAKLVNELPRPSRYPWRR